MKTFTGFMAGAFVVVAAQAFAAGAPNLAINSKKAKVQIVPAYAQCLAPNTNARSPLHLLNPAGGCTGITRLTAGGAHDYSFDEAVKGRCDTSLGVSGKPDIKLKGKCKGLLDNGSPRNGNILVLASVRVTSSGCNAVAGNPTGGVDCTMADFNFPVAIPCTAGACSLSTTINTLVPGAVVAGERGNIEIGQITLKDQDGDTAGVQGITVP